MGSHGRTGARRLLLGSNAEQVVRLSDIPVMIVKYHEALDSETEATHE